MPRFEGTPEQQAKRIARFQREARVAAQVWHPHVCPIFDVGEHEGQPFVVMALIEGQSLADRLASQGRFEDIGEAVRLTLQLLDALAAVHAHGITHRDLKPGNVLLDAAGRAVLTDFGLARPEDDAEPMTSEGMILGTPSYMAPEQAGGLSAQIGPPTDLYSLGVVLYQMLTGRLPFEGPALTVLHRIVHEEPPPPRSLRPDLPPLLEAALQRALEKNPEQRFADARTFAEALTKTAPASVSSTTTISLTPGAAPQARGPRRKVRWTIGRVIGWFIGIILVAFGGMLISGRFPELMQKILDSKANPFGNLEEIVGAIIGLTISGLFIGVLGVMCWMMTESFFTQNGLLYWARSGSRWCVEHAIANRVPLDVRNGVGDTALMVAAARGHADVVKVLLLAGVQANLRNPFGQSALDIARAQGRAEVVGLLQPYTSQPAIEAEEPAARGWPTGPMIVLVLCAVAGGLTNVTIGPRPRSPFPLFDIEGAVFWASVAYPVLVMGLVFLPLLWWTTGTQGSKKLP